jgi:hypothetical protein
MEPKARPSLFLKKAISKEEIFQNETLRPILKLQHELIITLAEEFLKNRHISWEDLKEKDLLQWLNASIKRDIPFKNQLIGLVIGQFKTDELFEYLTIQKEMNKRIIQMITERMISHFRPKSDYPT